MCRWTIVLPDSGPKVSPDIWRGGSAEAYDFVLNAMGNKRREVMPALGNAVIVAADTQPVPVTFSSDSTELYLALGARSSE
jgi:hypothetical protein